MSRLPVMSGKECVRAVWPQGLKPPLFLLLIGTLESMP